jgi:hypothetical protein
VSNNYGIFKESFFFEKSKWRIYEKCWEYGQNYPTFFNEFKKMAPQLKMEANTSFLLKPIELIFF